MGFEIGGVTFPIIDIPRSLMKEGRFWVMAVMVVEV